MSETGFQLELSRHFPDLFAYSAARAVAAAKKVEPRALRLPSEASRFQPMNSPRCLPVITTKPESRYSRGYASR